MAYLARFSYDVLPANRQRALDLIRRQVAAARREGRDARLLVPLTRGPDSGAALQFEVELASLDQLERVRHDGGPDEDVGALMHAFSEILLAARSCSPRPRSRSCAWTRRRRRPRNVGPEAGHAPLSNPVITHDAPW